MVKLSHQCFLVKLRLRHLIPTLKNAFLRHPVLWSLCVIIIALGAWSFWIEQTRLVIRTEELQLANWTPDTPPLKVAVVSDIHVGSPYWDMDSLAYLVEMINEQQPDAIFILGDYIISNVVGGTYRAPDEFIPILSRLSAPIGVFSVIGNHDWREDGHALIKELQQANIVVLENEAAQLNWHGTSINLIGIADDGTQHPDLQSVLQKHLDLTSDIQILMTHNPGIYLDLIEENKPTLMLAGHTHGGQVNFPIYGRVFVATRAPKSWAHGWTQTKNGPLLVTSGVGTSIFPVRFNQPPEFVLLSLTHQTLKKQSIN